MVKRKKIEMGAGKFKALCLKLMDDVELHKVEIVITKRGKPVARLVPMDEEAKIDLYGYLDGQITIVGDIISPIAEKWDADG